MPDIKNVENESFLDLFGKSENLSDRLDGLRGMMKNKAVKALSNDERFLMGIDALEYTASNFDNNETHLLSIAALSKIGSVKSLSNKINIILKKLLIKPPAPIAILKDPDERYYVAKALSLAEFDFLNEYLSESIVSITSAEKVRKELIDTLFARSSTLSEFFKSIADKFQLIKPDTQKPGDTVAKILDKIILALRPLIVTKQIEPGDGLGDSIQLFFKSAFKGVPSPDSIDVLKKTSDEAVVLIHDIVRTQISIVAEPVIYGSLDVVRSWFEESDWRLFVHRSENVNILVNDLVQAITLLAKQGVTDDKLFIQLTKLTGSKDNAAKVTSSIANKSGLNEDVKQWLLKGGNIRAKRKLSGMDESNELSADEFIATLMYDAIALKLSLDNVSGDKLIELQIMEPDLYLPIESVVNRGNALLQGVTRLQNKRNLQFNGNIGDVVEYVPNAHQIIGEQSQGVRNVKIIRSLIERVIPGKAESIVMKALVEPI